MMLGFATFLFKSLWAYNHCKVKLDYYPVLGSIEVSNRCNLDCLMCARNRVSRRGSGVMSLKTLHNVLSSGVRVRTVDFTGHGEPLLNKSLESFIKVVKPFAKRVGVTTNATLLDKNRSKSLIESGLDFACFSFEGVNKAVYEHIRVGANYETVFHNILNFIDLNRLNGNECKTILIIVDNSLTHSGLENFKLFWRELVDEIKVLPLHDWGGILDSPLIEKNSEPRLLPCFDPWYHIYIRWDGSVAPCCVWEGETDFGNINEQPLMEIWNSRTYQDFRASLLTKPMDHCEYCHLNMLGDTFSGLIEKPHSSFPFNIATLKAILNRLK